MLQEYDRRCLKINDDLTNFDIIFWYELFVKNYSALLLLFCNNFIEVFILRLWEKFLVTLLSRDRGTLKNLWRKESMSDYLDFVFTLVKESVYFEKKKFKIVFRAWETETRDHVF